MPGAEPEPLATEFLCEIEIVVAERVEVVDLPSGTRRVIVVDGGRVQGPGLTGSIVRPGAVFATIRPDGVLINDARFLVRTDDGADVHVQYEAMLPPRGSGGAGLEHLRSVVRFESASPSYTRLNSQLAVGRAKPVASGPLTYEVFLLR
jgi:hypothetical protein